MPESNKKRIYAFTLAEVILTLTIVGVVAALTIPSLLQNMQDSQLKIAWKSTYSDLNQAFNSLVNDNGGGLKNICGDSDHECLMQKLQRYLLYTKFCYVGESNGNCWHADNVSRDLAGNPITWQNSAGFILNNGRTMQVFYYYSSCSGLVYTTEASRGCGMIYVDVNGFKKPNVLGKDIFLVYIRNNSLKPFGWAGDDFENTCNASSGGDSGAGCAAQYLRQ